MFADRNFQTDIDYAKLIEMQAQEAQYPECMKQEKTTKVKAKTKPYRQSQPRVALKIGRK